MEIDRSINAYIERAIKNNWDRLALSDMGGINYQFKDVAVAIEKLHILFENSGVKAGDRIAICGKNSSNWAVIFLACMTSGVVAVPILHEFKADNIHHLVTHSESKLLFVDASIWENLDETFMPHLEAAIYISELGMPYCKNESLSDARNRINELFGKKYPCDFTQDMISYYKDNPDQLAVINYTSGSTGLSKGVMLSNRNIWSNVKYCHDHLDFLKAGDGIVNMLPLAHLYGMIIDMLHTFTKGCHLHFLTRVPSPKIILNAFAEVKPKLIITVPLILEKIIRNKIFPMLEKPIMKMMLKVPLLDEKLLAKIKDGLNQAFGGNVHEIIIGGAALNAEVEAFLRRIGFPYTVGYGMTECGPLISYAPSGVNRQKSCGKVVERMEVKIDSKDPLTIAGDLWVRGENVMMGYYKNPEATDNVMMGDGWMNTGDLCLLDEEGFIYICGRTKSMILGPSGQNIYPEEIEQKLNNLPYVNESLIIEDEGKLVALIYPDFESAIKEGLDHDAVVRTMDENLVALNKEMPSYSKVARYKIFEEEFEKTPKRSIKRYLYQSK